MVTSVRTRAQLEDKQKRFKDTLKVSLKSLNTEVTLQDTLACDRCSWRRKISAEALAAEKQRIAQAETKRAAQKGKVNGTSAIGPPPPSHLPIGDLRWSH